jgi:hypothetical protein
MGRNPTEAALGGRIGPHLDGDVATTTLPTRRRVDRDPHKEDDVTKRAGLWIDHRKAVVVTDVDGVGTTAVIASDVERQLGREDGVKSTEKHESLHVPHDESRDRKFHQHLDGYYDRVIATIHDAASVLILGPGEAKGELKKRIETRGHMKAAVTVETADKMSDREIETRVRSSFRS